MFFSRDCSAFDIKPNGALQSTSFSYYVELSCNSKTLNFVKLYNVVEKQVNEWKINEWNKISYVISVSKVPFLLINQLYIHTYHGNYKTSYILTLYVDILRELASRMLCDRFSTSQKALISFFENFMSM